ncbi:hypothetical protein BK658_21965 [Pseudomonas brassicacearum]|uniref:chitinase n=1 Tax=Pseudomonas brassicacearum TaxID=930166 RepID=A0A423GMJ7_9PSED|nr:hypothetical protein BK658_21965 [Pseudomonas brassicacearum]
MSKLVNETDPGTLVNGVVWGSGSAEKTYALNNFDPATRDDQLSYAPGPDRTTKYAFNKYADNGFQCFGYGGDWLIGDARYGNGPGQPDPSYATGGRGTNLMRFLGKTGTFHKMILGFLAIVGDKGVNRIPIYNSLVLWGLVSPPAIPGEPTDAELEAAETQWGGHVRFIDPWNDLAAYINCNFPGYVSEDYSDLYRPEKAQGVLGALLQIYQSNPDLELSLSLGGWSMSHAFYAVARERDPAKRKIFIDSIATIFTTFPMFKSIDIDWEYPAVSGNEPGAGDTWLGNPYDDDDAAYFAILIGELKARLPAVKISIASIAAPAKLAKSNIPALIEAGLDGVNVMGYDFFGTPWATKLQHHCNLYRSDPDDINENSVDAAVQYLLGLGVPSKMIYVGYANYSRNAQQAELTSVSPLVGTYSQRAGANTTPGCFEAGVTELPGVLKHYLDLEARQPLNRFILYTDKKANADFLYNPTTKVFMSLDTPRTVKLKGEYVVEHNLGGLFSWMIDHDPGLMNNAAREGVGCTLLEEVIDMKSFYYEGATTLQP